MKSIKINILMTATMVATIAPLITLIPQFTPKLQAQSINSRSCVADVIGDDIGSQVNIRSGPGLNFEVIGTVSVGNLVIIANDNTNRSRHISTLVRRDNQNNRWYMVSRFRASEDRGWMRADFLSLKCPADS